jgi:nicotinate-nucleotide adenylyltransferase
MRLGIFGGTFDPPHIGHRAAAAAAAAAMRLDRVLFMPAGCPPQKQAHACAEHRYRMTVLATEGQAGFEVSRLELDRPGPSYTVDTLRALQGPELFFICGADAIADLPSWHAWQELPRLAHFVGVSRPGASWPEVPHATYVAMAEVDVSSTAIRERVAAGLPIDGLVAPAVATYIHDHRLYVR